MGIYLRQLLAGRDFAKGQAFAAQMANFIYVIGDDQSRECMLVDPAWDIAGLINRIEAEDLELVGALVTHYHQDHIGGQLFGTKIDGLGELLARKSVKIHANSNEIQGIKLLTGVSDSDLVVHSAGDQVSIGDVRVKLLHTPGHTPGSQCFLVGSTVVSGDTLFIGSCGRVDLPGSDPGQMYQSLTQVLGKLPDETILYPGHNYARKTQSTIGEEKANNYTMRMKSLDDWLGLMGRA